ncbi:hypothetical protein PRIPAC_77274, partial [Pristionchus pacificus]|uniref:Uncharacterized protein n=1 Tax=Pristionchus pacificus TaxID=54126 RepID=A0A2A6CJV1_PRIPA
TEVIAIVLRRASKKLKRTQMDCARTLRLGFETDRAYFIDPIERIQTWLPIVNSLTVHPAMVYLLWEMSSMEIDLRIGYLLNEASCIVHLIDNFQITLIAFDWIFNFGFRIYGGIPYAALYCGGPLCDLLETSAIHFTLSSVITANVAAFMFLFMQVNILGVTIAFISPIPIVLTIDSVRRLLDLRKASVSVKTHQLTSKMLSTFLGQCVVAMVHMVFPLTILYTTMMIDYHESVSEAVMTAMRVVPIMALITDPLHFTLIFVLKTGGHTNIKREKLFSQRIRVLKSRQLIEIYSQLLNIRQSV